VRKYKRAILRHLAEKRGVKASKFVYFAWDKLQRKAVGESKRYMNVRHGTKPKRLW
jgi:hypothetical protein